MREVKIAEQERRRQRHQKYRRAGGAVLVVAIVIGLVVALSGGGGPKKKSAAPTTTTASKATTTTTKVPTAVAPVCPPSTPAGASKRVVAFTKAPPTCTSATGVYDATVQTDVGTFVIKMDAKASPAAVNNFVFLARYHFFDGTTFPRVVKGFVVQGGSPDDTTSGGPGYSFTGNEPAASCTAKSDCYTTGSVAMANSGSPSSDGSQFFIVLPGGATQLQPPVYSLFGQVVSGLSVVEKIGSDGGTTSTGTPSVVHHIVKVTIS
jgi:peptidyl-prolyl cis-trans isomerase B (cyclophilin B)